MILSSHFTIPSPKNTLLYEHSALIKFRKLNGDTILNVLIALTSIWPVVPIIPFTTFVFLIQDPIRDPTAPGYHDFVFSFHLETFLKNFVFQN